MQTCKRQKSGLDSFMQPAFDKKPHTTSEEFPYFCGFHNGIGYGNTTYRRAACHRGRGTFGRHRTGSFRRAGACRADVCLRARAHVASHRRDADDRRRDCCGKLHAGSRRVGPHGALDGKDPSPQPLEDNHPQSACDLRPHVHCRHGARGLFRAARHCGGGNGDEDTSGAAAGHCRDCLAASHHCQPHLGSYGSTAQHAHGAGLRHYSARHTDDFRAVHAGRCAGRGSVFAACGL